MAKSTEVQKPAQPVYELARIEAWAATQSFRGVVAGDDKEATNEIRLRLSNVVETLARKAPTDYAEILNTAIGRASIAQAVAVALETGLFPGTFQPHAWLIPRKEGNVKRLFWQPSARGLEYLAHKAGFTLSTDLVYEGDTALLLYEQGAHERKITASWRPAQTGPAPILELVGERPPLVFDSNEVADLAPLVGALVVARDMSGKVVNWRWISRDEINKRRKVSRFGSVWREWTEEMCLKTAIIYALSRGICPTTLEIRAAMEADAADSAIEVKSTASPLPLPEPRQLAEAPPIEPPTAQSDLDRRAQREPTPREEAKTEAAHEGDLSPEDRLRAEIEELEEAEGVMPDERGRFRGDHGLAVPFNRATMEQLRAYKARIVGGAK